jgi:hypothetical protein
MVASAATRHPSEVEKQQCWGEYEFNGQRLI